MTLRMDSSRGENSGSPGPCSRLRSPIVHTAWCRFTLEVGVCTLAPTPTGPASLGWPMSPTQDAGGGLGAADIREAGRWRWSRRVSEACSKQAAMHLKPCLLEGVGCVLPTETHNRCSFPTEPPIPPRAAPGGKNDTPETLPSPSLTKPSLPLGCNDISDPVSSVVPPLPEPRNTA